VARREKTAERGTRQMIRRFCSYIEKVFDFRDRVRAIHDGRLRPRIPTSAIWMSAFSMFAMHGGALNADRSESAYPQAIGWWESILAGVRFLSSQIISQNLSAKK